MCVRARFVFFFSNILYSKCACAWSVIVLRPVVQMTSDGAAGARACVQWRWSVVPNGQMSRRSPTQSHGSVASNEKRCMMIDAEMRQLGNVRDFNIFCWRCFSCSRQKRACLVYASNAKQKKSSCISDKDVSTQPEWCMHRCLTILSLKHIKTIGNANLRSFISELYMDKQQSLKK